MRKRSLEERYQTLIDTQFYKILRDRELTLPASFLLVYLRGLASYFGRPDISWDDKRIVSDIPSLSKRRLYNARHELQTKGLIRYLVNRSRFIKTSYIMLDTIVADIKSSQTNPFSGAKNAPVEYKNCTTTSKNCTTLNNKNKYRERYKNKDFVPVNRNQMREDVRTLLTRLDQDSGNV